MNNIWDWNARKCFRAQVADASPHQLLRGGCEWSLYAWSTARKWGLSKTSRKKIVWTKKNKEQTPDQWKPELCPDGPRIESFGSLLDLEKVSRCFLHVWSPLWRMEEEVWRVWVLCWWHSWCYLHLVGPSFMFQRTTTPPQTHLQAMEELYDQEGEWSAASHDLTSTITLDHRVKSKQPTSAQQLRELLQECWNTILTNTRSWLRHCPNVQSCHHREERPLWRV